MSNVTPDAWIERQPEDEHVSSDIACTGCGEFGRCRCDEIDETELRENEDALNDTVKCCPECETPNQFGELCNRCREELESERI